MAAEVLDVPLYHHVGDVGDARLLEDEVQVRVLIRLALGDDAHELGHVVPDETERLGLEERGEARDVETRRGSWSPSG